MEGEGNAAGPYSGEAFMSSFNPSYLGARSFLVKFSTLRVKRDRITKGFLDQYIGRDQWGTGRSWRSKLSWELGRPCSFGRCNIDDFLWCFVSWSAVASMLRKADRDISEKQTRQREDEMSLKNLEKIWKKCKAIRSAASHIQPWENGRRQ